MSALENTKSFAKKSIKTVKTFVPNGALKYILYSVITVSCIMIGIHFSKNLFNKYNKWKNSSQWILNGTKSAKNKQVILQDPSKRNSVTLNRSENMDGGIEFTYVFWMYIDDWSHKYGEWKHVFHKGNATSWPLRAPGVWLHPEDNTLRVYMNSFVEIGEHVDVPNIPLNKWFCVAICLQQKNLDIFFNGNLVKRIVLKGLPKQNYGDVYINAQQGFGGYLSNIKYYNYYISYSELLDHLNKGPSMMPCVDSNEMPPYLTPNWWSNSE